MLLKSLLMHIFSAGVLTFGIANCAKDSETKDDHTTMRRTDGKTLVLSSESGFQAESMSLTVDISAPAGGGAAFGCWRVLDPEFELGEATCFKNGTSSVEVIKAKHVSQICSALSEGVVEKPTAQLGNIDGCDKLDIYSYKFEPDLTIEVSDR